MATDSLLDDRRITGPFWLCLLAVTLLAGGIRLYHLSEPSLLIDEVLTVRSCAEFGATPPLYKCKVLGYMPTSLALWAQGISPTTIPKDEFETWRSRGITEFPVRIGSALIGILTVPILGLVSCRLIGRRAAGFLALLLAVAPWHIYWSQTGRFYALQFLFYNLSLVWYFAATRDRSRGRLVGALVLMILAFLTQPPALVIVAIFAIDWAAGIVGRQPVRLGAFGWAIAIAALGLCGASLLVQVEGVVLTYEQFAGDLYQVPVKLVLGTIFMVSPAVAVFAAISGWWLVRERRRLAIYLLLGALAPTLVYALVSLKSYVALRYTFVCLYAWLALAAVGADQLYRLIRPRMGRLFAAAPLCLLLIPMLLVDFSYFTKGAGFHARWREAYALVAKHREPSDLVCGYPRMGRYYMQDADVRFPPQSREELEAFEQPAWIVIRAEEAIRGRRYQWLDDLAELKGYFDLRVLQPYSSVRVYRYEPRSAGRGPNTAQEAPTTKDR